MLFPYPFPPRKTFKNVKISQFLMLWCFYPYFLGLFSMVKPNSCTKGNELLPRGRRKIVPIPAVSKGGGTLVGLDLFNPTIQDHLLFSKEFICLHLHQGDSWG